MQAVTCGIEGRMPKGILEPEEAKEVATFVAAYAGQIGKGPVVDTAGRHASRVAQLLSPRSVVPRPIPGALRRGAPAHIC